MNDTRRQQTHEIDARGAQIGVIGNRKVRENTFQVQAWKAAHTLDKIGHIVGQKPQASHPGVYLDVGNSTSGGMDAASEVRGAKGRAALCHVKDWNPQDRTDRRLGAGGVDFDRCFAALDEIGYDSYIIVELPPDAGEPDAVARHSIEFLKGALDG